MELVDDRQGGRPSRFMFFRSFEDFARTLRDDALKLSFYEMLCAYAFDGIIPAASHPHHAVFLLMRPSIDRSLAKSAAGARGGRAKGESKARFGNQNASKTQAKRKQRGKQNASEREGEREKEEDNNTLTIINDCARVSARAADSQPQIDANVAAVAPPVAPAGAPPSIDDILRVCANDDCTNPGGKSIPAGFGRYFHAMMEGMGWQQTNGRRVTRHNFRPFLFTWWRKSTEDEWAEYADGGPGAPEGGDAELAARARRDWEEARRMKAKITGGKK